MELKPKRINIFVGKPNVGKSNILEALSILSGEYDLHKLVRFKRTFELLYDFEIRRRMRITTNLNSCMISLRPNMQTYDFIAYEGGISSYIDEALDNAKLNESIIEAIHSKNADLSLMLDSMEIPISEYWLDETGGLNIRKSAGVLTTNIRRYIFDNDVTTFSESAASFLTPPFGQNLLTILLTNKSLRQDVASYFTSYGLDFLIDQRQGVFELVKNIDGIATKYDYSLIADTLRRVIFHLAAIKSNTNSVLLFEEPEAHCFPPYISQMAQEMIEAKTNQFFVATHSPYLLNTILENTDYAECAVFVASYKDYQTQIRELTASEVEDMLDYGQDVFINYKAFSE